MAWILFCSLRLFLLLCWWVKNILVLSFFEAVKLTSREEDEEEGERRNSSLSRRNILEAPKPLKLSQETSQRERDQQIARVPLPTASRLEYKRDPFEKRAMPPTATQPINGFGSIHVEKHGGLQGFGAQTRSSSSQYGVMKKSMRSSGRFHTSTVEDTSVTLQRRVANELGSSFSERVSAVDYTTLVEWIHYERLSSLPKEGSAWDKVSCGLFSSTCDH